MVPFDTFSVYYYFQYFNLEGDGSQAGLSLLISAEIVISTEHRSHQTLEEWKCNMRQWKAPSRAVKPEPSCCRGCCWQSRARSKYLTWAGHGSLTARLVSLPCTTLQANPHQLSQLKLSSGSNRARSPHVHCANNNRDQTLINCSATVLFCHSSWGSSSGCESASSFSSSKGLTH